MIEPSLQIGGGNWANKSDSLLGYHKNGANFYADELTFSRNSLGSYTDANGLIQSMPYNLLTYSEQFNNAIWNKRSGVTITADSTTAPNGTTTADTANYSSGDGYIWVDLTLLPSTQYTISVYAKGSSGSIQFNAFWGTGSSAGSTITLTSDWQRLQFTFTTGSTTSLGDFGFFISATCYLWGAQLNIGATALPYFATTTRLNLARVDYKDNVNGSLLLESQRTNLALYSEQLDNAAWEYGGITKTANDEISPDGYQNADKIEITTLTTPNLRQTILVSAGTSYTFSFYAKSDDLSELKLAVYDLSNAAFIVENQIRAINSTWSRVSLTFTTPAGCTSIRAFIFRNSDSLGSFYAWGASLEAGSYSTSYIKSEGAATTRLADSCSKTGISDKIGQTEGTFYYEFNGGANDSADYGISLSDGTTNNRIIIYRSSTNTLITNIRIASTNVVQISTSTLTANANHKVAVGYANNNVVFYVMVCKSEPTQVQQFQQPIELFLIMVAEAVRNFIAHLINLYYSQPV